ncbi:hypothetical protein A0H81_10441 [Grifola frondosa]|uniref:F-box domain-containing protein n=1 Tax=Grifola frondosa TaxID=5627 RepID=A0A1C7LYX7_GRIFR|nr:hypothetical protein A0H81_10441 [Grifola frondosa]
MVKIQSHKPGDLLARSPTSIMDLDLDVIYIILSSLPRRDLVRLMNTCRTFNRAGVQHLLSFEDLSVYYPTFQSELVQFPRMRKLSVYEADPPPALIALIFPNLMDLTVYGLDRVKDPRSPEDYQYRQQNLSVQLAGGGFTSLDRLAGGPLDLYRLGLTCQVRCVDIFRVDCDTHDMVAYILSNSRPSHVIIAFIAISPSCVRCFPDEVAVRLTYLQCTIDYMSFDGISDAFDTFYLLLQHSPLTHLKLYFTTGFSKRVPTNFLEESRPEAFASQIIASHPSIRYIAVGINDTERLFWKVTTAEDGEIVVDKAPEEDISVVMEP